MNAPKRLAIPLALSAPALGLTLVTLLAMAQRGNVSLYALAMDDVSPVLRLH
jgi:hypothetical protein